MYVPEQTNHRLRVVTPNGSVTTLAGSVASFSNGFGTAATFNIPFGVTADTLGQLYISDYANNRIRKLLCIPSPSGFYSSSGSPVLCPAGSFCPLSSMNATLCPKGTYSFAGASSCTPCSAGTFSSAPGSTSCQQCPGGHFCSAGTASWASQNCGRGRYCPDGSSAPTPCPHQVPPSGGWGALQAQGPAFLVDTALCLNHCFWNFTSGDGLLSKC